LEGEVVLDGIYILAYSLAPFCCVGFPWLDLFFLHTDLFLFSRRSFGIRVLVILGIGFFFNFDTLVQKRFLGRNEIQFDNTFPRLQAKSDKMVNWILPMRGVQAVLSVTVLGLMAYGQFLL
jgi:hypothetical protein